MQLKGIDIKNLIELRHQLHREPELSGKEFQTAATLVKFLNQNKPDKLITEVAGAGILAIYNGKLPGKTILLRCDMDALPINENSVPEHNSQNKSVSHKCGHDGHMAIMCGVAELLSEKRPDTGTVILLFQPAEETGMGAEGVISQLECKPDLCFATHNLPGFTFGSIITREGFFAAASTGMKINLKGKSSHAAEPQEGVSPALAIASLISLFSKETFQPEGVMSTLTHASIGEPSFGTSPGTACVMLALRARTTEQLKHLIATLSLQIEKIVSKNNLTYEIEFSEEFPATENSTIACSIVNEAATELGYKISAVGKVFPWSEDFGHFTALFPGALFGLGAGASCPALHSPDYDFPDGLIPVGVAMFIKIIESSLKL